MTENNRCAMCGGVWHPATGMMVGSPSEFPVCGRCMANEVIPCVRTAMAREIRVSTPAREAWRATPRDERGPRPWVNFCESAETSIGAIRREG